jgi:hypothetical protein
MMVERVGREVGYDVGSEVGREVGKELVPTGGHVRGGQSSQQ